MQSLVLQWMELSLLQLGPRVGCGHWTQWPSCWSPCFPQLLDRIWKAQILIHSHTAYA